jgi:hypothetical protein
MAFWKRLAFAVVMAVVVVAVTQATLQTRTRVSSTGRIKAVGCSVNVDKIDWGLIGPGETVKRTVIVNNTGTVPATLSFTTGEWNPPEAADYLYLSWNYAGTVLQPKDAIIIDFQLYVSENIQNITDFSFTITITATSI